MRIQGILAAAMLLVAVLAAGCADRTPTGEFTTDRHTIVVDGSVNIEYQERVRPASLEGLEDLLCQDIPDAPSQLECRDPETRIRAHFMGLPEPSGAVGYQLVLVDAQGTVIDVGNLERNQTMDGGWDLPEQVFDENFDGMFNAVELRHGDFIVATAGTSEGANAFSVYGPSVETVATGSWVGTDLTLEVEGAVPGVNYQGILYEAGPDGGAPVPVENFPITGNGQHIHAADRNINSYVEFHIHVAGSMINVAQADI